MILPFDAPFLFLRHGETAANAADLIAGAMDLPLTPAGRAQARAAAQTLAALPAAERPATIWCSPLARARETAAPVAARLGLPVRLHAGLAERNWGVWEGAPRATLRRDETPAGGEGPLDFRARIRAALAGLDGRTPVLIVAHSGVARELHALIGAGAFRRPLNGEVSRWSPAPDGRWHERPLADTEL